MDKKIKLFVVMSLALSGCSVKNNPEEQVYNTQEEIKDMDSSKEIIGEEEKVEQLVIPVTYNNIVDGLLNKNNEFSLETNYMILNESNKKVGSKMIPTYIVIHNTANSAPAINEAKYLNSSSNTSSTSFHFAVDDTSVYQTVNLNYNSWHAGNISMNKKSIGIEIAKSTIKDTNIKDKAIKSKPIGIIKQDTNIKNQEIIIKNILVALYILAEYGYF